MTKKQPKSRARLREGSTVERLRRLVHEEEARLAAENEPGKRQTHVRTVLLFYAELRKAEAAAFKQVERLSRTLVIAWARTLNAEERRSIAREVLAIDEEGSVLA